MCVERGNDVRFEMIGCCYYPCLRECATSSVEGSCKFFVCACVCVCVRACVHVSFSLCVCVHVFSQHFTPNKGDEMIAQFVSQQPSMQRRFMTI